MAHCSAKLQDVKPFSDKKVSIVSSDTEYLIPQWFKDRIDFNYDEYVGFVLESKEMWDANSDVYPDDIEADACLGNYLNVKKTFCYLCNVQIPLPYINEHLESSKHLTHRKIAEIGMERIKNQMTQNYYAEARPPSMYFCSTCILIVADIDKLEHLKSKSHNNAVVLDKILNDFLNVYTNYESDTNDTTQPAKLTVDVTNNNNVKYKNFNADHTADYKHFLSNKVHNPIESDVKPEPDFTKLEEYIKYLDSNASTYRLKYLDGFYLRLEIEDSVFLKVKHENYHGLVALGKRHVQCKLCMLILKDMKEHMLSSGHKENILLPINKHCIRKLNSNKHHCVLCNDIIDDPEVHAIFNTDHHRLLMNALSFDANENVENKTIKTQSKVSDKATKRNNKTGALPKATAQKKAVQPHKYDVESRKDRECKESSLKVEVDKDVDEYESKHIFWDKNSLDWFAEDLNSLKASDGILKNQLKCAVCNITFSIYKSSLHFADPKHLNAYDALIAANCLKKYPKYFHCRICNIFIIHGEEIEHINSATHVSSSSISKVKNNQSSVNSTGFPNDYLDNNDKKTNIEHNIKREDKDKFAKAVTVVDNGADKAVGNAAGNVNCNATDAPSAHCYENIESITPKAKKNKAVGKKKGKQKQAAVASAKAIDTRAGENTQGSNLDTVTFKYVCKVCSIIIPDKPDGVTEHMNEGYHKNYFNIIESNKLKIVGDMYICELCHECMSIGQHFNHMHDLTHLHHLQVFRNTHPHAVTADDTKLNGEYSIIATVPSRRYPCFEMMKTDRPDEYKCRVCALNLPKDSSVIKSHVEEKKHTMLLQEILTANLIIDMNKYFNCCVCCAKVPKENLFDHVNDGPHKAALQVTRQSKSNLKGTLVCFLCNVVYSLEHRQSLEHQINSKAMVANKIVVTGEFFFCKACKVYFIRRHIENHISMPSHFALVRSYVV